MFVGMGGVEPCRESVRTRFENYEENAKGLAMYGCVRCVLCGIYFLRTLRDLRALRHLLFAYVT